MSDHPQPRRHHVVPRLLLQNFTETGREDGYLHVFDLKRSQHRRQRPKEVAHERDFYRVDIDGKDAFGFEKALALLEERTAPVVRGMIETWELPEAKDLVVLLEFAAYLGVRVPKVRKRMLAEAERLAKEHLREASASPEAYEAYRERAREKGRDLPDIGLEKLRELADGLEVEGDQTGLVSQIPVQADRLFEELRVRAWSLLIAPREGPAFVCSDAPMMKVEFANGAGTSTSGMWLPLSPRLALASDPVRSLWGAHRVARQYVAYANSLQLLGASHVFAQAADFIWLKNDGRFAHASDAYGQHPSEEVEPAP